MSSHRVSREVTVFGPTVAERIDWSLETTIITDRGIARRVKGSIKESVTQSTQCSANGVKVKQT